MAKYLRIYIYIMSFLFIIIAMCELQVIFVDQCMNTDFGDDVENASMLVFYVSNLERGWPVTGDRWSFLGCKRIPMLHVGIPVRFGFIWRPNCVAISCVFGTIRVSCTRDLFFFVFCGAFIYIRRDDCRFLFWAAWAATVCFWIISLKY